jgi:hypothetical protein
VSKEHPDILDVSIRNATGFVGYLKGGLRWPVEDRYCDGRQWYTFVVLGIGEELKECMKANNSIHGATMEVVVTWIVARKELVRSSSIINIK